MQHHAQLEHEYNSVQQQKPHRFHTGQVPLIIINNKAENINSFFTTDKVVILILHEL